MGRAIDPIKNAAAFVRAHLGRHAFAPFSGTDTAAWSAFVYLLVLYGHEPGEETIAAMRSVVAIAQPNEGVLRLFVQAIPAVLDWGYVERIWPAVCDGLPGLPGDATLYGAFERDTGRVWR